MRCSATSPTRSSTYSGTTTDLEAYRRRVAALFGSLTLPYELGTVASFDYTGFNGRSLCDNVMDNMLSLLTNSALGTGIGPDPARFTDTFPIYNRWWTADRSPPRGHSPSTGHQ
jgi:hypothetical protein